MAKWLYNLPPFSKWCSVYFCLMCVIVNMFAKMKYDVSKFKHTVDLVLANLVFFFFGFILTPPKRWVGWRSSRWLKEPLVVNWGHCSNVVWVVESLYADDDELNMGWIFYLCNCCLYRTSIYPCPIKYIYRSWPGGLPIIRKS